MGWISVTKKVKKKYDAEGRVIEKTVVTTRTRDDYEAAAATAQGNHTDENEPAQTAVSSYTNIGDLCSCNNGGRDAEVVTTAGGEKYAVQLQG